MRQIQLLLIPTPGAKPEFLATVTTSTSSETSLPLPPKIVLEGYTRDTWAWKPHSSWTFVEITPVDTKSQQKLDGFLKYLKERQKCAYGRFSPTAVAAFSYIQSPKSPMLRFTHDATELPNCSIMKQRKPTTEQPKVQPQPTEQPKVQPQQPTATTTTTTKKKAGMLGNLLGAQKRTDQHMNVTVAKKRRPVDTSTSDKSSQQKTAQQVLQEFRQAMEQKMLDFDLEGEETNCCKVRVELANIASSLQGEEKTRVTMEVLKYIVYEQAEEVNEEWVACKEPSEFVDDIIIAVYKQAPPEILEHVNQVEVTEEMRGVNWAISEARRIVAAREDFKFQHEAVEADDDDLAILNTNKRDRRTIEEIQLGLNDPKRSRND
jgi:hypothetical protein